MTPLDQAAAAQCRWCREGLPVYTTPEYAEQLVPVARGAVRPPGTDRWHRSPDQLEAELKDRTPTHAERFPAVAVVRTLVRTHYRHGDPDPAQPTGFRFRHVCEAAAIRALMGGTP